MADSRLRILIDALWRGKGQTQSARRDVSDIGKTAEQSAGGLNKAEGSASKLSGTLATFGTAAVVGGIAVAGNEIRKFSRESVAEFETLERQATEVFTLLPDLTEQAMFQMRGETAAFGADVGRLSDDVVPALYQSISAGVPRENAFSFLEVASDAALGGVTELETAVDGITSVVNAYGEEVLDAQRASDLMFTSVRGGKTTFDELSSSLFQVVPTAASLNVEFENITAALATLTAQGTPTRVAATQLRQVLVELGKEGTIAAGTFERMAGVSFAQFVAQGGNLQDALVLMEQAAEESGGRISDMFGSVEAGQAALGLTGAAAEKFANELANAETAAGATTEAAELMAGTLDHTRDRAEATTEALQIQAGEALAPAEEAWLRLKIAIAETGEEYFRQVNVTKAVRDLAEEHGDVLDDSAGSLRGYNEEQRRFTNLQRAITRETADANAEMVSQERQTERLIVAADLLEHGFSGS
ncbi:MAG: phage tail tape measure protein, partial [Chloroflexota bacterium]